MLIDPRNLFQVQSTPSLKPGPAQAMAQPAPSLGFQSDQFNAVSQLVAQPQGPQQPLPADEGSYPEVLPNNLMRESFVTKLMFTLKAPLQLFNRQDPDTIVKSNHKDVRGNPIRLAREAAAGLDKIMNETKQRGLTVRVVSSYRSVEQQTYLWEQALKKYGNATAARKWVAPPGKSRHNFGKAIDIYMYRNGKQIPQKEFDEIVKLAGMYRPMSWEGWHIEPLSTKAGR